MDLKEVNELSLIDERKHWWICTRFLYIDKALELIKKPSLNVLEFGCGTGQNLWYVRTKSKHASRLGHTVGVDPGLSHKPTYDWLTPKDDIDREMTNKELSYHCLLAMDVLEHIDDERQALKEWVSSLDDDGVMLLTVPAFQHLWSYHDVFLDHKRRYTRSSLIKVARECGLRPMKVHYAFGHLYPLVYLVRKLFSSSNDKSDLTLPHPAINWLFYQLGKVEAWLGGCPYFGTSVIGIFKKSE